MKSVAAVCSLLLLISKCSMALQPQCAFSPTLVAQKQVYRVGVLAFRGVEKAISQWQATFSDYLTAAVGRKIEGVSFEMVPVPFGLEREPIDELIHGNYDFVFTHPGMHSCLDSEIGMHSLVSLINKRKVNGQAYELTQFGGVIFTWAGNDEINTVEDLEGSRLGLVSISGLGSGQMQFREMRKAGLHHLQSPSQLIFMHNQNKVVNAVLNKDVEVGFVRTDQLERFIDPKTEKPLDLSRVKVVGRYEDLLTSTGSPFPFPSSTPLYPEWTLASFPSVGEDVERLVQESLIDIPRQALVAAPLLECNGQENCTSTTSIDEEVLQTCDTTQEISILAHKAQTSGKFAGWRPPLSYMPLRNMQEEIGFIQQQGGADFKCTRGEQLEDSIVCPEGHFKKRSEDIHNGCEQAGLECYGFQCICKPCVKAFDVDVYPVASPSAEEDIAQSPVAKVGCDKFSVCGEVVQGRKIAFQAVDNRQRRNARFVLRVRVGEEIEDYEMARQTDDVNSGDFTYQFEFDTSGHMVGHFIFEVLVNGEQIPESPFRLEVTPRNCAHDTGDSLRVADANGECVCEASTVEIGSHCVPLHVLLPSIIVPIVVLVAVAVVIYVAYKRHKADLVWKVKPEEISFDTPLEVLGRGRFGLVLLGKFRGTKVAVKKVAVRSLESGSGTQTTVMETKAGGRFFHLPKTTRTSSRKEGYPRDNQQTAESMFDAQGDSTSSLDDNGDLEMGCKSVLYSPSDKNRSGMRSKTASRLKTRRSRQSTADFIKEIRLLSQLRHPCVTTVMGATVTPDNHSMLIMEYMELGSLRDVLRSRTMVVDEAQVLSMVYDVARGIHFLHASDIIHSDVKSNNVLVDSTYKNNIHAQIVTVVD